MQRKHWWIPSLVSCLAITSSTQAVDYEWKGGSGVWENSVKWTPASGPPKSGDTAFIYGQNGIKGDASLSANVLGSKSPAMITIGGLGRLDTAGYRLGVAGAMNAIGAAMLDVRSVQADATAVGLLADEVEVSMGAQMRVFNGKVSTDMFRLTGGSLWFDGGGSIQGANMFVGNGSGALDAKLNVFNGAAANISAPTSFLSDADVTIFGDSSLRLGNHVKFYGGGHFAGGGLLQFDGTTTSVLGKTTIDMPNGRVDLDGNDGPQRVSQTLTVNDDFTVKASSIDSSGNSSTYGKTGLLNPDTIVINGFGTLDIQLTNPNLSWTMAGHLDIHAPTNQLIAGNLAGSDMILTGTARVQGNSQWTQRSSILGTITVENDSYLRLGGTLVKPDRLEGGSILGQGTLGNIGSRGLHGFGTIGTKIDYINGGVLRADDGTLTLTAQSQLQHIGTIGTLDDGTLRVQKPWNTNVADNALELLGGKVTGDVITNGGTTRGYGRIEAQGFINQGLLRPTSHELVIDTTDAPDLDGSWPAQIGEIDATQGDLRVTHGLSDSFQASLTVGAGRRVTFDQGWKLDTGVLPGMKGSLNLQGGANSISAAEVAGGLQQIASIVNVDGEAAFHAPTHFEKTAQVNLPGVLDTLRLFDPTEVDAGAFFAGNGRLVNVASNSLKLNGGASINTRLHNAGTLELTDPALDASVDEFTTTSLNRLKLDIQGKLPANYDTLRVTHNADIDGTLQIDVNAGSGNYSDPVAPGTQDVFALVVADHVAGSFSGFRYGGKSLTLSSQDGGLYRYHDADGMFRILQYQATDVQLLNYRAEVGDSNGDGAFNSEDFVYVFQAGEYEDAISANSDWTEGDWNNDDEFDSADFVVAFQSGHYENGAKPARAASVAAVPEPSTAVLSALALLGCLGLRRR